MPEKQPAATVWPSCGLYRDDTGRELTVRSVHPGDPEGREIRGEIAGRGDYAADYNTFTAIWRRA